MQTCAKLPLFGWMIARSDGDSLRRVLDADSSAASCTYLPHQQQQQQLKRIIPGTLLLTGRPVSWPSTAAAVRDRSATKTRTTARISAHNPRTYAAFADWSRDGMGEHRSGGEVQSRMQTPRPSHTLSHSTGTPREGITARWLMGGATRWPCYPPRSSCRCCI
jgi:hypothetical protein